MNDRMIRSWRRFRDVDWGKWGSFWSIIIGFGGLFITVAIALLIVQPNTPTATPEPSPTPLPSITLLPENYEAYDDFVEFSEENWSLSDDNEICQDLEVIDYTLVVACRNDDSDNDYGATIHNYLGFDDETIGVASTVYIEQSSGNPLSFTTRWVNPAAEEDERAYHFEINEEQIVLVEYYPKDDWNKIELAQIEMESEESYLLRIEKQEDGLVFWVNDELIELSTEPNWNENYKMVYWGYSVYIWKGGNYLKAHIESIGYLLAE